MLPTRRTLLLGLALLPLAPTCAAAGEVILTVTGLSQGASRSFDLAGLQALGAVEITTSSIWTEGTHRFTGVPLATLAKALGIDPQASVTLHALNDYEVEMPLSETEADAPILAFLMDGKPMSVRDKGPIWLVYPYDADPAAYQTVTTFARSVWQLDRIDVNR